MMKYFVTWVYLHPVKDVVAIGGSNVLSFSGEFNLYLAHKQLQEQAGNEPVIILNWQSVSTEQGAQYDKYCQEVSLPDANLKKKAPLLRLAPKPETDQT